MKASQNKNPILHSSRMAEWWIPKAGNLLAIIFLVIALTSIPFHKVIIYFFPSIITIVGIGGFGHIINDLLDIPSDKKAGKKNRMEKLSFIQRSLILSLFLILALAPWLILPFDQYSIGILSFEFLLLIVYAIPPFRFKEKGILGIFSDGLYAYAVPAILAAYTYFLIDGNMNLDLYLLSIIFIWQFTIGIHNIIIHQILDYENDLASGTTTFITQIGLTKKIFTINTIIFYLEIILFGALNIYLSIFYLAWYWSIPCIILLIKYIPLRYSASFKTYNSSTNPVDTQVINISYHKFLPFWNLAYCVLFQWPYLLFLPLSYLLLNNYSKTLKEKIPFYNLMSIVINQSIYWYRIHILGEDEKTALREHYSEDIFGPIKTETSEYNLAIINRNPNKYTETFVKNHIENLPFNTYFYYGKDGYFPEYGAKGNLLSNYYAPSHILEMQRLSSNLPDNYYQIKAFQNELIHKNIDLVLAEFGTTAATIFKACHDIQKPLVCIFHGYDAHNKQIRNNNEQAYLELFKKAKLIIAVSNDILSQLEKIGAPKHKLRYLPCGVNTQLFQYSDHSKNPPIFLMVGRLAVTKSPHLSILAFEKVLQVIPNAKLIIIGNDEGGGIYEICITLAKALGIDQQIEFKGIKSPEEVYSYMKRASAFIQHSLTTPINGDKEGTPVSIMEAMSSGLPVISTKHAGIQEIIINRKTGFLVEEYDIANMSQCMIEIIQDSNLNLEIGKNAHLYIKNNPLISNHIDSLKNILIKIIQDNK